MPWGVFPLKRKLIWPQLGLPSTLPALPPPQMSAPSSLGPGGAYPGHNLHLSPKPLSLHQIPSRAQSGTRDQPLGNHWALGRVSRSAPGFPSICHLLALGRCARGGSAPAPGLACPARLKHPAPTARFLASLSEMQPHQHRDLYVSAAPSPREAPGKALDDTGSERASCKDQAPQASQ